MTLSSGCLDSSTGPTSCSPIQEAEGFLSLCPSAPGCCSSYRGCTELLLPEDLQHGPDVNGSWHSAVLAGELGVGTLRSPPVPLAVFSPESLVFSVCHGTPGRWQQWQLWPWLPDYFWLWMATPWEILGPERYQCLRRWQLSWRTLLAAPPVPSSPKFPVLSLLCWRRTSLGRPPLLLQPRSSSSSGS